MKCYRIKLLNFLLFQKITFLMLFIASVIFFANVVMSHKCYVCGPNAENCDEFDPNNTKYIKQCASESKGCSLQINGTVLVRSCENIAIEDCKVANNIQYCFCRTELCNSYYNHNHNSMETTRPIDDEDTEIEGSGIPVEFTTEFNSNYINRTHLSTSGSCSLYNTTTNTMSYLLIFMTIFCNWNYSI